MPLCKYLFSTGIEPAAVLAAALAAWDLSSYLASRNNGAVIWLVSPRNGFVGARTPRLCVGGNADNAAPVADKEGVVVVVGL